MIDYNKRINEIIDNNRDIKLIISHGSTIKGKADKYSDADLLVFSKTPKKYLNPNDNFFIIPETKKEIISKTVQKLNNFHKISIVLKDYEKYDIILLHSKKVFLIKVYFSKFNRFLTKRLKYKISTDAFLVNEIIYPGYKIHIDNLKCNKIFEKILSHYNSKYNNKIINKNTFVNHYNSFWNFCYTAAIKLIRKDLMYCYIKYDQKLREEMVKMIEWKTLSENKNAEVFYRGKNIDEWADIDVTKKIKATISHKNSKDSLHSLFILTTLYKECSHELAKRYNYPLNIDLEKVVVSLIKENI